MIGVVSCFSYFLIFVLSCCFCLIFVVFFCLFLLLGMSHNSSIRTAFGARAHEG